MRRSRHDHSPRPPERRPGRPLRHRARARRGRHGDRVPGAGPEAQPPGRHQGPQAGASAERFLKEIETTANLQHPHILPLFDSGEADGFLYYVMPYVEGETLRDRLDRETQLGVDEAVGIAADVADALDYAHRQGVIHRDIKPANILLQDGRPLVADFGIALAVSAAGGGRMTETGLSLGTPYYMSPEQATADRDLTPRSDVYSLGAVLYEMLAGEPPHTGPTGQAVVARILAEDAQPVTRARKSVPPHVAAAVRKALEKLPADRFESAGAFADALRDPGFRYATADTAGSRGGRRYGRAAALLGWLAAVVLAGAALWPAGNRVRPPPAPALAFELAEIGGDYATLAITDDGTVLAALDNEIRVRSPSALAFTTLHTDPRQVDGLASSPDGRWIVFSTFGDAEAGLYKIPAAGGDVVTLLDATSADNLVWGEDGWIYFRSMGGVLRIPENGGPVDTLLAAVRAPGDLLDGGRALLLTGGGVWVLDLESGDSVRVAPDGRRARWSPSGHVLYTHAS
ncbi:MAG: protein kinase, partial [Gemmatimonadetes bacterium]|nr:protein kinase [Gemmatimonadota bacterium]NIQ58025.1 protein kinase [Gemmatimonadota bacterium]NIU78208.1 protein kinase [Gammaproteobacteria bacterium]NIX47197.1 protein kinase [Gemmatimonadota bacterium]NIY11573.1 protein kinase [Gemmatimonadota bacterium]